MEAEAVWKEARVLKNQLREVLEAARKLEERGQLLWSWEA